MTKSNGDFCSFSPVVYHAFVRCQRATAFNHKYTGVLACERRWESGAGRHEKDSSIACRAGGGCERFSQAVSRVFAFQQPASCIGTNLQTKMLTCASPPWTLLFAFSKSWLFDFANAFFPPSAANELTSGLKGETLENEVPLGVSGGCWRLGAFQTIGPLLLDVEFDIAFVPVQSPSTGDDDDAFVVFAGDARFVGECDTRPLSRLGLRRRVSCAEATSSDELARGTAPLGSSGCRDAWEDGDSSTAELSRAFSFFFADPLPLPRFLLSLAVGRDLSLSFRFWLPLSCEDELVAPSSSFRLADFRDRCLSAERRSGGVDFTSGSSVDVWFRASLPLDAATTPFDRVRSRSRFLLPLLLSDKPEASEREVSSWSGSFAQTRPRKREVCNHDVSKHSGCLHRTW